MKITVALRRRAAAICALAASNQHASLDDAVTATGFAGNASTLALLAILESPEPSGPYCEADAEAMLRSGWVPKGCS